MTGVLERRSCRVCSGTLYRVLDLGPQQLSDFLTPGSPPANPPVPLTLCRCDKCGLIQLKHTVPSEWLYRHYWYQSGINESMVASLADLLDDALDVLGRPPLVAVDIGANDGTFLRLLGQVVPLCVRVAYEPARNLHDQLRPHCEQLVPELFPAAWPLGWVKADLITSIAMFYDLEEPHAFVRQVKELLTPDGVWVIQMAALRSMVATTDIGNICHEHLEYYSLATLQRVLEVHGLAVVDASENATNGGSLRVCVRHQDSPPTAEGLLRVRMVLERERAAALDDDQTWQLFRHRAEEAKRMVKGLVGAVNAWGGTVDVYGASTKGNTLLQFWELDRTQIRMAIERSPAKVGLETVGGRIPIVEEVIGRATPADLWLCLPWHFRTSILERERSYLQHGGKILFPGPVPEVVGEARS